MSTDAVEKEEPDVSRTERKLAERKEKQELADAKTKELNEKAWIKKPNPIHTVKLKRLSRKQRKKFNAKKNKAAT